MPFRHEQGSSMDRLTAMEVFVRIVETGSFSAVGRDLGMTQPTVSKQLTALERQLKTRLLNRSTRQLSLTEAGSAYYESCKRIIDAVREADGNLGQLQTQLTGVLRINTSIGLGQVYLGPMVLRFQEQHPELSIDLSYSDRFVDLVEEGIDVAIRIGRLKAILPEYAPPPAEINAVYPSARHISAKVRAFTEFLRAEFQEIPILRLR